jgi:porphobilinogen deaminase
MAGILSLACHTFHLTDLVALRARALPPACPACPACLQKEDGKLAFRGLVSTPDGKKMYETTRVGSLTEADAVAIGRDAGAQLKAEAQKDGTVFDW